MKAIYRNELVTIVRIEAYRAYIVWRGMVKRVNKRDLDMTEPPMPEQMNADSESYRRVSAALSAVQGGLECR